MGLAGNVIVLVVITMLSRRLTHRDFIYMFSDLLSLPHSHVIRGPSLFINWSGQRIWTRRLIARVIDVACNPNRTIHKGIGAIAGINDTPVQSLRVRIR
jgi:hypothetical protein